LGTLVRKWAFLVNLIGSGVAPYDVVSSIEAAYLMALCKIGKGELDRLEGFGEGFFPVTTTLLIRFNTLEMLIEALDY
jgi:hypothetical protein